MRLLNSVATTVALAAIAWVAIGVLLRAAWELFRFGWKLGGGDL